MDNTILKKRLNTFRAGKSGRLQEISNDVVLSVHRAWENWPGTTADFCRELGVNPSQMGVIIRIFDRAETILFKGDSYRLKGKIQITEIDEEKLNH
jgi:hypothetical protein